MLPKETQNEVWLTDSQFCLFYSRIFIVCLLSSKLTCVKYERERGRERETIHT